MDPKIKQELLDVSKEIFRVEKEVNHLARTRDMSPAYGDIEDLKKRLILMEAKAQ